MNMTEPTLTPPMAPSTVDMAQIFAAHAARDAPKAWRFAGEMHEIAATFASHDLSPQFHVGASQTFAALARFRDADPPPDLDRVLASLLGEAPTDA